MPMNSIPAGNDFLNSLSAGLGALMTGWMRDTFGHGANNTILAFLTWTHLGLAFCLVLVVLLLNGLAVRHINKLTKVDYPPNSEPKNEKVIKEAINENSPASKSMESIHHPIELQLHGKRNFGLAQKSIANHAKYEQAEG